MSRVWPGRSYVLRGAAAEPPARPAARPLPAGAAFFFFFLEDAVAGFFLAGGAAFLGAAFFAGPAPALAGRLAAAAAVRVWGQG